MQAIILATGESGRLGLLTEHMPAPMLPLANRPVMAYTVELLARAGLQDIGVSLHRMGSQIEGYFGDGSRFGVRLTYLLQREPLGSAGALKWAASELRDTAVVLPGDALVDFDLQAALAFHRSHGGMATVVVREPDAFYAGRPLAVAPDGRVLSPDAQPSSPDARVFHDTGVYIFEPQIVDCIEPHVPADCYADLLPVLMEAGALQAFVMDGYWNPIHSAMALQQAQLAVLASATGTARDGRETPEAFLTNATVQGKRIAPGIVVGRRVAIHPAARLAPPVYIGDGCRIERDVELGPGAVIGANAIVDEGATVRNSTVLDNTYVGRLVRLDCRIVRQGLLIDAATGESLPVVDRFLLGGVSPEPVLGLLSRAADCLGALLLLLLWSPAIVLIGLVLLAATAFAGIPGRIFEHRARVRWSPRGENAPAQEETYALLHFRTRRDESHPLAFGRWLERSQMDRLPALWNVFKGDLRLVGVKPLTPSEAARLADEWQRRTYRQHAGFTGLWFVQSGDEVDLDRVVVGDAYYVATRNSLEDLRLLWRSAAGRRNLI